MTWDKQSAVLNIKQHYKHSELTQAFKNPDCYYLVFFADLIAGSETLIST